MGGYPKLDSLPRIPAGLFRNGDLPWSRRDRAKSLDKLGFCIDLNRLLGRSGCLQQKTDKKVYNYLIRCILVEACSKSGFAIATGSRGRSLARAAGAARAKRRT